MKKPFIILSTLLASGTALARPPIDTAGVSTTITKRIKSHIQPLQKTLLTELAAQRKAADKQEHIEMKQAQKVLQDRYSSEKKQLTEEYKKEKAQRKKLHTQVTSSVTTAQRTAHKPAKTLGRLLDNAEKYIELIEKHAATAHLKSLARKAKDEHSWLSTVKETIKRSSIDLHTPLKK